VAPLILLPFLENSFKHGVNYEINSPFIHIYMDIEDNHLSFNVQNSYKQDEQDNSAVNEGIGLKNVRRRLALLYPNQHHLSIKEDLNVFEISLILNWPSKKRHITG
jgi:LytS/YehU family sensor histidine kinase